MAPKTDHDLLVKLEQDMCWVKKIMSNHLKHHWAINIAVGAIVTAILQILMRG